MKRGWCWLALMTVGCAGKCGAPGAAVEAPSLMSEVRERFAQRDAKLKSYAVESEAEENGAKAKYRYWYRAPQRMKGDILEPQALTLSFDGKKLYQLNPAEKSLTVFDMTASKEKAALVLTQNFAPFVPEGYRVPLFPNSGTGAQKTTHPKAADAVMLTVTTKDEAGEAIGVEYVLRWPSMDFLQKTTRVGSHETTVKVDEEYCDEKLKLCVPKALSQFNGGNAGGTTRFTRIVLNEPVPEGDFVITAPEGFAVIPR